MRFHKGKATQTSRWRSRGAGVTAARGRSALWRGDGARVGGGGGCTPAGVLKPGRRAAWVTWRHSSARLRRPVHRSDRTPLPFPQRLPGAGSEAAAPDPLPRSPSSPLPQASLCHVVLRTLPHDTCTGGLVPVATAARVVACVWWAREEWGGEGGHPPPALVARGVLCGVLH